MPVPRDSKKREESKNAKTNPNYGMKGKKHSEETKQKLSKIFKGKSYIERYGKKKAEEIRKKQSDKLKGEKNPFYGKRHTKKVKEEHSKWMKGRFVGEKSPSYGTHLSDERKQKLRELYLGKTLEELYGEKKAKSIKKKLSKLWTGKHHTEEAKRKISQTLKGHEIPESTKEKISKTLEGKYGGSKSHFWKGGIANGGYGSEFNPRLRRSIRKRDKYTCQLCARTQKQSGKLLAIHHINYLKEKNNQKNLISLCNSCHSKTNSKRDYWFAYFCYGLGVEPEELIKLR